MATNENCTSNPSSSDETSNATPQDTPNAFTPEFLDKLYAREDAPLAALEAELRGPWKVVELPVEKAGHHPFDAERWAVLRTWEDPKVDAPSGTFRFREIALIYAAALAVASRGAVLSVRDARDDDEGGGSGSGGSDKSGSGARRLAVVQHTLEGKEQVVGHIPIWDDDVVDALRYVEALLHCNEALAQLLEAGCGPVAELLGRRLMAVE